MTESWMRTIMEPSGSADAVFWVFSMKNGGDVAGSATLWNLDLSSYRGELGYELRKEYWGKGLATEGITEILNFGFGWMGLNRIEACPLDENEPSKRLLAKFGFRYEGNLRKRILFDGKFRDQIYYGLLRDDWIAGKR